MTKLSWLLIFLAPLPLLWFEYLTAYFRVHFYNGVGLEGHRAVVFGASSGIGKEIVRYLASNGAYVVVTARRLNKLNELQAEFPGHVHPFYYDASDPSQVADVIGFSGSRLKRIDSVYLNHAMFYDPGNFSQEALDLDQIQKQIQVNYLSFMQIADRFLRVFRQYGGGRIIITSSGGIISGIPFYTTYCASKSAMHMFFTSLRMNLMSMKDPSSITIATVGNVEVERSGDRFTQSVKMASPVTTARDIVAAGMFRLRGVDTPFGQIFLVRMASTLFPSYLDHLAVRAYENHPCFSFGEWAAFVLCII